MIFFPYRIFEANVLDIKPFRLGLYLHLEDRENNRIQLTFYSSGYDYQFNNLNFNKQFLEKNEKRIKISLRKFQVSKTTSYNQFGCECTITVGKGTNNGYSTEFIVEVEEKIKENNCLKGRYHCSEASCSCRRNGQLCTDKGCNCGCGSACLTRRCSFMECASTHCECKRSGFKCVEAGTNGKCSCGCSINDCKNDTLESVNSRFFKI